MEKGQSKNKPRRRYVPPHGNKKKEEIAKLCFNLCQATYTVLILGVLVTYLTTQAIDAYMLAICVMSGACLSLSFFYVGNRLLTNKSGKG